MYERVFNRAFLQWRNEPGCVQANVQCMFEPGGAEPTLSIDRVRLTQSSPTKLPFGYFTLYLSCRFFVSVGGIFRDQVMIPVVSFSLPSLFSSCSTVILLSAETGN